MGLRMRFTAEDSESGGGGSREARSEQGTRKDGDGDDGRL